MDSEQPANAKPASPASLTEAPILLMQTAFLGDLLLSIPLLLRLRRLRPHSPLYLVARASVGRLIRELNLVDEVFEIEKGQSDSYKALQERWRDVSFEWILCPHPSLRSALFCWGIRGRLKMSFRHWWNFIFFKERIERNPRLPDALRQLSLLRNQDPTLEKQLQEIAGLNLIDANPEGRMNRVPVWASMDLGDRLRKQTSPLPVSEHTICIFPGSQWNTKRWSETGFIQLAEKLVAENYQIYWMGSKDERPLTEKMAKKVPGTRVVAGELSLMQSLVLMSHARLVICNDSGSQHLAAVAGTPTVSIFGPTVLSQGFRPWNSQALIAELRDVKCRPCGAHGHQKCPIQTHECMQKLPPSLVLERAQQLL